MAEKGEVTIPAGNQKLGQAVVINSKGEQVSQRSQPRCDLVFVIDTTGSMDDKIAGLLATCSKFVEQLSDSQIDWQIALVAFGDLLCGEKIVATGFSHNVAVVKETLRKIPRFGGGGNDGESSLEAIDKALGIGGYRQNTIKVMLLLTDEPAHQHHLKASTTTGKLREKGVLTFVIAPPLDYFKAMAKDTGGDWFQIGSETNFLSILEMLDKLITKVSTTVAAVQEEAGGDVHKYLQIKGGN